MSAAFEPPPFLPSRWLCNGHLQTVWRLRVAAAARVSTEQVLVELPDGDAIVLHDDRPDGWTEDGLTVLLVHGLGGSHASPYMLRMVNAFCNLGVRVFRMDMRGCGAAHGLARNVAHAGRSDDVIAAVESIAAAAPKASLSAIGVSLGGAQVLRAVGRVGLGLDPRPNGWERMRFCAAVAPPIDLERCSRQMQRWMLRPYNRHFIEELLQNIPPQVAGRRDFQAALARRPRTLWEFDDRITAPLSGFTTAEHYYHDSSAAQVARGWTLPTLILAAQDDPIVPTGCFADVAAELPATARLLMPRRGGHVGFVDRRGNSWMDEVLLAWSQAALSDPPRPGGMPPALADPTLAGRLVDASALERRRGWRVSR